MEPFNYPGAFFAGASPAAFFAGGVTTPLYALFLAYTNDALSAEDMPAASGGLVFTFGLGAIAGPLVTAGVVVFEGDARGPGTVKGPAGLGVHEEGAVLEVRAVGGRGGAARS